MAGVVLISVVKGFQVSILEYFESAEEVIAMFLCGAKVGDI